MRAVAAAAQAAMAVDPETTAVIAEALRKAEAAAAGQLSCHSAISNQIRQHVSAEGSCRTAACAWRLTHKSGPKHAATQRSSHACKVRSACVCCRRAACRW